MWDICALVQGQGNREVQKLALTLGFALSLVNATTQGDFPQSVRGLPPSTGPVSPTDSPLECLQAESLKGANYRWM